MSVTAIANRVARGAAPPETPGMSRLRLLKEDDIECADDIEGGGCGGCGGVGGGGAGHGGSNGGDRGGLLSDVDPREWVACADALKDMGINVTKKKVCVCCVFVCVVVCCVFVIVMCVCVCVCVVNEERERVCVYVYVYVAHALFLFLVWQSRDGSPKENNGLFGRSLRELLAESCINVDGVIIPRLVFEEHKTKLVEV